MNRGGRLWGEKWGKLWKEKEFACEAWSHLSPGLGPG